MVSHTTDLAVDFGRKVRNLISTDEYHDIFPQVSPLLTGLQGGGIPTLEVNYACGIGSALAGGADLLFVDDPHSEQDVINGNFQCLRKP